MTLWLLSTLASLAIASYATVGVRCLRRFSRARLDELCRQEHTRPLFSQIVELRDRATLGAESLQVLATFGAIASGVAWIRSVASVSPGFAWLESAEALLIGLVILWFALVWLPTGVARLWADSFVLHSWSLWKAAAVVLAPSVWGAELLCLLFRRMAGRKIEHATEESLEEEILTIVSEGEREGLLEEDARDMIEGVIELGDVTVARIMTPRTDMVSIHIDLAWEDVIQLAITAGHTRIPAYNRSPDDIVGILHSKDLLAELAKPDAMARQPWQEMLRKPFFVPETQPVDKLLQEFQRSRNHIAVVLDEFGGVSGLVTIEDALEEIVGEIADEHDEADGDGIKPVGEHAAEALARVRIHEINERLGLSLPEDEHFDTIGGFVFHELGRIPNVGEELIWHDVRIKVLEATGGGPRIDSDPQPAPATDGESFRTNTSRVAHTMERMSVSAARTPAAIGRDVRLQGWIRTRRDSKGGFSFLELNDGSSQANIQIVADAKLENYESEIRRLAAGCSVTIEGQVRQSPAKGQPTEVHAARIVVHGWSDPETYPLQKKNHSWEFLRTIAHLRPRTNTFGAIARLRNQVSRSIHDFFQEQGFLYVHSPIITASDCEGAGEMFKVTTLDLAKLPRQDGKIDFSHDFFHRPAYLTVSGQLNAESFACALGKVYTFGPTFRAENSNTSRHLAEFWMVEPEMAFFELEDGMRLAEAFLKRIFRDALERRMPEMEFFRDRIDNTVIELLNSICSAEFVRLSYTEAIAILEKSGRQFEFPIAWGKDLQAEHERHLTEQEFHAPVILYDYPRGIKSFYMRLNDDGRTVRAMDILVPKVGEIIGGSQREERLDMLETRMREQGLDPAAYWWYLDLRRYGTVPHSGFGLGLERVLQFITGMGNIRDVIPFPRTPGSAEF